MKFLFTSILVLGDIIYNHISTYLGYVKVYNWNFIDWLVYLLFYFDFCMSISSEWNEGCVGTYSKLNVVGFFLIIILKTQVLICHLYTPSDSRKKKVNLLIYFLLFFSIYPVFYADLSMSLLKTQVNEVLSELGLMKNQQELGSVSCVSIILHHLLKELPIEVVNSNVVHILHLIEFSKDNSFGQVSF